jgi:hypothetical protein
MSEQNSSSSVKTTLVKVAQQELVGTTLRRHPAVGVAAAILLPMLRFIARQAKPAPKPRKPGVAARARIKRASNKHQEGRPTRNTSACPSKTTPRDLSIRSVQTATVSINHEGKGADFHG